MMMELVVVFMLNMILVMMRRVVVLVGMKMVVTWRMRGQELGQGGGSR